MASDRRADADARIRAAMAQLLNGEVPDGLKCDVKSLCVLAGVPRATLYRTYPRLKAEFDRQRDAAQDSGQHPDPRTARVDRLKTEFTALRTRLADRDREIIELNRFRDTALSRLVAQHDEITALKAELHRGDAEIRRLPTRHG